MRAYNYKKYDSFTDMYQDILCDLLDHFEYKIAPRGFPVREITNVSVLMNPNNVDIEFTETKAPERQAVYDKYKKNELEWYLSGNTLASSAPSKFWHQLADTKGHITSNYGHMMLFDPVYPPLQEYDVINDQYLTPFEKVIETLIKDPDSRQAIVHYNVPNHCWPGNKDFPCTMSSQLLIRNGKLHMSTLMRSCDIFLGFTYDVCWNAHFMGMVFDRLKESGFSLELGELTMNFGSLHMYEKNLEIIEKICEPA